MGFVTPDQANKIIQSRQTQTENPEQTGGLSSDMVQKAALLDIATTGGKNLSTLTALSSFFPGAKPKEISDADQKKIDAKNNAERIVNQLENLYYGEKGPEGNLSSGRLGGIGATISKALGFNQPLSTYSAARTAARPTLARAAGDVGNLSAPEQEAAVKLLPTQYSTPEEAAAGFQAIREKFGLNPKDLSSEIGPKKTLIESLLTGKALPIAGATLGGAIGGLAGGAPGIAGAGFGYTGGDIIRKELAKSLGVQGAEPQNALQSVGETALGGAGAAASEALALGAGKLIGKGVEALKPTPAKLTPEVLQEGLNLAEKGNTVRNTAIKAATSESKKIEGNKLTSAISEWATRAKRSNPTQKETIDKFVKGATKSFKGKQLTAKTGFNLWQDANQGFSSAGKVGNSLEAEYHRVIRDTLRKQLEKVAPGFEEGTSLIKQGLLKEKVLKGVRTSLERKAVKEGLQETPSKLGKILKGAGKTAGTAVGLTALYKLLGMRGQGE